MDFTCVIDHTWSWSRCVCDNVGGVNYSNAIKLFLLDWIFRKSNRDNHPSFRINWIGSFNVEYGLRLFLLSNWIPGKHLYVRITTANILFHFSFLQCSVLNYRWSNNIQLYWVNQQHFFYIRTYWTTVDSGWINWNIPAIAA